MRRSPLDGDEELDEERAKSDIIYIISLKKWNNNK